MRAEQERAARKLRADRERLTAAAVEMRRAAAQAGYAGWRGTDHGFALAALVDSVTRALDQVPGPVRRDALAAAAFLLDGPDGPHDPRAAGRARRSDGPGH